MDRASHFRRMVTKLPDAARFAAMSQQKSLIESDEAFRDLSHARD